MPPQHVNPPGDVVSAQYVAAQELCEPESEKAINRAVYPSTKYESKPTWAESLCGWAYVSWIMLGPFLDMIWVIIPTQIFLRSSLLFGKQAAWPQKLLQWLEETYYSMLGGLLETFGGMEFVITMDDQLSEDNMLFPINEQVLLICNHRTEIDWIFFWNLSMRFNCHGRIRVMMKSIIRCLPGPGWAMLMLDYPYISRKWDTDQGRIKSQIDSYKKAAMGYWLCMFPEGTALFNKALARSHEFARERGEPLSDYVLIPRVRGFELCATEMEPDAVLDVTVGYPELQDGIRPSPLRLVRGQFPRAVHVHLTKYSKAEVAAHKSSMDSWVKARFQEKETRLRKFYKDGKFEGKRLETTLTNVPVAVTKGVIFHSFLCVLTTASWYYFPLTTFQWFSFCMAIVVHRIQAFGE